MTSIGRAQLRHAGLAAALCVLACHTRSADPTTTPQAEPRETSTISPAIQAIVDAPDRDPDDRTADDRRKPAQLLAFLDLHPGDRVADLGAGFGYTTELLARAVGPTGKVYGQNPEFVLKNFAEKAWTLRLAKPVNANVVRLDREFVDPFPAEVRDLDVVVNVLFYHDFEWMGVDRMAHNLAVRNALKDGGRYVIVDAHAKPGAGASASQSLHRVEESLVVAELEAAGFELVRRGDFLRNPHDSRDWNALPWQNERGEFSDKFVLEFRKRGPTTPTTCSFRPDPSAAKVRSWSEAHAVLGQRLGGPIANDDAARKSLCDETPCAVDRPAAVALADDPNTPAWVSGGFVLPEAGGLRVWAEQVGDAREYQCTPRLTTDRGSVGAFDHARLVLARHLAVGVSSEGTACEIDVDAGCTIACFYDALHEVDLFRARSDGHVVVLEARTPLDRVASPPAPLELTAIDGGIRIDGCTGGPIRVSK